RMLTGALPDLSQGAVHLPDGLPAALAALVAQSTDPDPTRRPAHAGAFLQTLGAVVVDLPAKPKVQVVSLRKPLRVVAAVAAD
ncbi:MAG: serine/threonine protein kinase, partial [Rhodospirillaceae bacterium]|nr:serine/threonine protein kinase [Rhodospirillales bacterium]